MYWLGYRRLPTIPRVDPWHDSQPNFERYIVVRNTLHNGKVHGGRFAYP